MSQEYPSQPPHNQPNSNNPQPYYPQQPQQGYSQQMPVMPGDQPPYQQNTPYPQPGQQFPETPPKKKRKSVRETWNSGTSGKCGIIFACGVLLLVVFACAEVMNATTSTGSPVTTPQTDTQNVSDATAAPTTKPVPTTKPKPTAKPAPTQSPAQLEAEYKASTTDTTVAALDKDGNADSSNDEHFTATLVAFVKDSSGNTAGANVTDGSGSFVQVIFTPGTDITQLNANDTIEVWGTNQGVSSGTNAFGGTVQEVVIQANYLSDQTTGYKADS